MEFIGRVRAIPQIPRFAIYLAVAVAFVAGSYAAHPLVGSLADEMIVPLLLAAAVLYGGRAGSPSPGLARSRWVSCWSPPRIDGTRQSTRSSPWC